MFKNSFRNRLFAAMLLQNGLIRPQDIRALPAENRP